MFTYEEIRLNFRSWSRSTYNQRPAPGNSAIVNIVVPFGSLGQCILDPSCFAIFRELV